MNAAQTADRPRDEPERDARPQAALWTPRGRAAIATIRLRVDLRSWPASDAIPFRAASGRPLSAVRPGRIAFGHWGDDAGEEVVVCALDEQALEIHCHGGEAAAARILRDLEQAGCELVDWPETVRRASGLLQSELDVELTKATTLRAAGLLLEQADGVLRGAIESMRASASDPASLSRSIAAMLKWAEFGCHLARPWSVVLGGRPNVGKSSLINALVGYTRSIVFDQPGTTRDVVTARAAVDGWPIELSDTAGLRGSDVPLEAAGIARARRKLAEADLPVILVDRSAEASDEDGAALAACPGALVVSHKCDLSPAGGPAAWERRAAPHWLSVSSKTGEGVDALVGAIASRLVPEVPPPGTAFPVTPRQTDLLARALDHLQRSDIRATCGALDTILHGLG